MVMEVATATVMATAVMDGATTKEMEGGTVTQRQQRGLMA